MGIKQANSERGQKKIAEENNTLNTLIIYVHKLWYPYDCFDNIKGYMALLGTF
jgi:hypothetical protein